MKNIFWAFLEDFYTVSYLFHDLHEASPTATNTSNLWDSPSQ